MSLGTARLSDALQTLIDARLDTIDRMLLGRVPRPDRLAIVREVESQVFERLHERDVDRLTREDVLGVLARLDPPEAYLPDDEGDPPAGRAAARVPFHPSAPPARSRTATAARASGIIGLSSAVMVLLSPLLFLLAEVSGSEAIALLLLCAAATTMLTTGLLAVVLGILSRRAGAWSVVGMVAGGISLLISLFATGYVMLLFFA
jgi:hypothetical protein